LSKTSLYNFDIKWRNVSDIKTSYSGHGTVLRVNTLQKTASQGDVVNVSGILLRRINVSLSDYAILVIFELNNTTPELIIYDVVVFVDTIIADHENHHVISLPNEQGFHCSDKCLSDIYTLNVIGGNYPLVSRITRYWFGPQSDMFGNVWNQVSIDNSSGTDVAIAFSWQNHSITTGSLSNISFIFRSGTHYPD